MKMGKTERIGKQTYITRRRIHASKEEKPDIIKKDSIRKIYRILGKCENLRTTEEKGYLESCAETVNQISKRKERLQIYKDRVREKEDTNEIIEHQVEKLAEIISRSKHLVCYTGAGISTSARIPDYRGSQGIWTLLQQGKDIGQHDLSLADPTFTHMALFTLHRKQMLRFVVSQNCDGLHLRAGLPRTSLSEVHGNMYIEVCKFCKPTVEYWRLFDTTEQTARFNHKTNRRCHFCSHPLVDTIVHFGEKGILKWPLNWAGACEHAEKADVILCLGSSLKVLKKYPWLWQMDRPQRKRAKVCIINLQWTPKDKLSTIKINGKCDDVMKLLMKKLNIEIPAYDRCKDPIFAHSSLLCPEELHTVSQPMLKINGGLKYEDVAPTSFNSDLAKLKILKENGITRCDNNYHGKTEKKRILTKYNKMPLFKKRQYVKTNINSRHLILMDNRESSHDDCSNVFNFRNNDSYDRGVTQEISHETINDKVYLEDLKLNELNNKKEIGYKAITKKNSDTSNDSSDSVCIKFNDKYVSDLKEIIHSKVELNGETLSRIEENGLNKEIKVFGGSNKLNRVLNSTNFQSGNKNYEREKVDLIMNGRISTICKSESIKTNLNPNENIRRDEEKEIFKKNLFHNQAHIAPCSHNTNINEIKPLELSKLSNNYEYCTKLINYCTVIETKLPYWYDVGYAYSGLHSIIQPPPPEVNIWSSIIVPIFSMNRNEAKCEFCFDNYAEYNCQFYRKYEPEFLDKKFRNCKLIVCECCDHSDDEKIKLLCKKPDKRTLNEYTLNKQPIKVQPGWYGKGYKKNRKRK